MRAPVEEPAEADEAELLEIPPELAARWRALPAAVRAHVLAFLAPDAPDAPGAPGPAPGRYAIDAGSAAHAAPFLDDLGAGGPRLRAALPDLARRLVACEPIGGDPGGDLGGDQGGGRRGGPGGGPGSGPGGGPGAGPGAGPRGEAVALAIRVATRGVHTAPFYDLLLPTRRRVRFEERHHLRLEGDLIVEARLALDLRALVRQLLP